MLRGSHAPSLRRIHTNDSPTQPKRAGEEKITPKKKIKAALG
jgi:hypothetical protein